MNERADRSKDQRQGPATLASTLRRKTRLWLFGESGGTAVEFAFVLPVLVIMFAAIVQFGAMFFAQNNMANAARETARALAVGTIETPAEAEVLANSKLTNWGIAFQVTSTLPDPNDPNDTDYTVVISAPLSDVAFFDLLGVFNNGDVTASASMRGEI